MNESSNKANAFNNMSANFGFAVAKVQQNLQVCKKNRIFLYFLLGGLSPSTKQVADIRESRLARRESVERRIGSMVQGKYWMAIEW